MTLTITPARLTRWLSLAVGCLVLAGLAGQFSKRVLGHDQLLGFVRLFDLDGEGNIPAWYSSMTLLAAAGLLAIIARATRQARAPYALHWTALAVIFLGLSIDEAASIHELAVKPLRAALGIRGVLLFAWVIPGGAVVGLVGLAYFRFVLRLPAEIRRLVVIAGGMYVGGALGLEMVGGYITEQWGGKSLAYLAEVVVEETMEMAGIVVFIHALLSYIGRHVGQVQVRVDTGGPDPPGGR